MLFAINSGTPSNDLQFINNLIPLPKSFLKFENMLNILCISESLKIQMLKCIGLQMHISLSGLLGDKLYRKFWHSEYGLHD